MVQWRRPHCTVTMDRSLSNEQLLLLLQWRVNWAPPPQVNLGGGVNRWQVWMNYQLRCKLLCHITAATRNAVTRNLFRGGRGRSCLLPYIPSLPFSPLFPRLEVANQIYPVTKRFGGALLANSAVGSKYTENATAANALWCIENPGNVSAERLLCMSYFN